MDRLSALQNYLRELIVGFNLLADEKRKLQQAQARITQIAIDQADLTVDAQDALDKINALQNSAFTLQDVRRQFNTP